MITQAYRTTPEGYANIKQALECHAAAKTLGEDLYEVRDARVALSKPIITISANNKKTIDAALEVLPN